jgi:hypothetical protein
MRRNVIDRMALLCTLHADGPKTLRLLREAGCTDLDKLGALGPDRLAKLLSLSPASARRLMREGEVLRERLDPNLEREEVMYAPTSTASTIKPPPAGSVQIEEPPVEQEAELPAPTGAISDTAVRAGLDLRDRALLDKVMNRWRAEEPAASEAPPADLVEAHVEEPDEVEAVEEPIVMVPAPGLQVGDLAGLDEEICERLRVGGVHSLEELATCPIDEVTRRTGLSFTRARTMQFLACRSLSLHAAASQAAHIVAPARASEPLHGAPKIEPRVDLIERLSPAAPQQLLPTTDRFGNESDEGAGGPFA